MRAKHTTRRPRCPGRRTAYMHGRSSRSERERIGTASRRVRSELRNDFATADRLRIVNDVVWSNVVEYQPSTEEATVLRYGSVTVRSTFSTTSAFCRLLATDISCTTAGSKSRGISMKLVSIPFCRSQIPSSNSSVSAVEM